MTHALAAAPVYHTPTEPAACVHASHHINVNIAQTLSDAGAEPLLVAAICTSLLLISPVAIAATGQP
jgi:hypothetical protein